MDWSDGGLAAVHDSSYGVAEQFLPTPPQKKKKVFCKSPDVRRPLHSPLFSMLSCLGEAARIAPL